MAACLGGVLLLAALLATIPAGRRPFWSSDEARFALLGQDALEHGRWLVAEIRGREYLNKPQLFFWLVALASMPLGRVTETSAAIPGAIASVAAVAGVVALGWRLWGWTTGVIAGLILATTPLEFDMAHQVLPDMMLSACLVWALYFLTSAARAGWPAAPMVGFYVCVAAALLSKGPQALAAIAAAAIAVALTDGPATLARLRPALGLGAMLVVAAVVWMVPYQLRSAGSFGGQVLGGHYVTWYMMGSLLGRLESLAEPLAAFMPWTVLLAAAPLWWRQSPDAGRRRVVLWTATLWVLVAASGNFRARYVLPVLPGLALLTADVVTAPVAGRAARALRAAALVASVLAVAVAVAVSVPALQPLIARALIPEDRTYLPTAPWERTAMAVFALGAAGALLLGVRRRAVWIGTVGLGLGMAGMLIVQGITYPVRYTRAFDVRGLTAAAVAGLPPDAVVFAHPDLRLSYDVYLRRRVVELPKEAAVREQLVADPRARVIMPAADWQAMAPAMGSSWRVLASATVRDRGMVVVGQGAP
jgi:4-amino-4-deoxy-L-arabinose transferase-like glycosyltransferase